MYFYILFYISSLMVCVLEGGECEEMSGGRDWPLLQPLPPRLVPAGGPGGEAQVWSGSHQTSPTISHSRRLWRDVGHFTRLDRVGQVQYQYCTVQYLRYSKIKRLQFVKKTKTVFVLLLLPLLIVYCNYEIRVETESISQNKDNGRKRRTRKRSDDVE